ncbi:type I toxin-antitoxin system Fst family toxin [Lacticaseibacillus jixiensis]
MVHLTDFFSDIIAPVVVGIVLATYADWLDRRR